ncbi:MAG: PAS domain S-box protein [Deltaproteobacteria bacterium]|nr:PAS domain S-box protein [Deltaproteobacteria bacterium]
MKHTGEIKDALITINKLAEEGQPTERIKTTENQPDGAIKSFTDLFIGSPIGIYIVQEGKFLFVNPEFQETAGYSEGELLGKDSSMIILPDDRDMVRENAVNMLKGKRSSPYLYRAIDKHGDIKWIIESVTSIDYGGRRAVLGYFMDNTEGERAKEALRLSEEKFHKAFHSSPDWFVISTLDDGFYIDVNDAFLRSTGYRLQEVIGHTSKELGIWINPDDRNKIVKVLKEQGSVRDLEVRFRMKSGEIRHVLWSSAIIDYGDEKCCLAMTRDITARKRAEQERLEKEKVQGVLETAGAACHELNQPLQFVYYLLDEISEENPQSKSVKDMKKQCDRMREITNKLESITTYETTDYIQGSQIIDIHKASKKKGSEKKH